MTVLTGADFYHGDDIQSFAPLRFVYLKASQGITDQDPAFARRRQELENDKIPQGAYHFFEPEDNIQEQMENFGRVVGSIKDTELPPWLDLDTFRDVSPETYLYLALEAVEWIQFNLKRKPMIYINLDMLRQIASLDVEEVKTLASFPLVLADYNSELPFLPLPWTKVTMWQKSETGFDHDVFFGDENDLQTLITDSKL